MQHFSIKTNAELAATPIQVTGALDLEASEAGLTLRRLPAWTKPQVPAFMELTVRQTSGVRLEFATDADAIELEVWQTRSEMAGRAPRPAIYDWVANGTLVTSHTEQSGDLLKIDLRRPNDTSLEKGQPGVVSVEGLHKTSETGVQNIAIWLPTAAQVALRRVSISAGATLAAPLPEPKPTWVHHGSSISHCTEALSPTRSWPAVAADLANVDLRNLAFAGNCQLDQFVARTIRDQPADLISLKLGINVVNMDSLRERTFTPAVHGFLDTIREGQPHTPIAVISPIYCPSAETNPGPTLPNDAGIFETFSRSPQLSAGCLTLTWIRKILTKVVAARQQQGDHNIHYIDGLDLFGAEDAVDLPDALHPNGSGYVRMGERFHALAFVDGPFGGARRDTN